MERPGQEEEPPVRRTSRRRRGWWVVLLALVVVGCTTAPDQVSGVVVSAFGAMEQAGPAGILVFALLYGAVTVTGLPASTMQLTSGFLFGPWWGFVATFALSNGWGFVGFLLGRTLLRDRARQLLARFPMLLAIDDALISRGTWMVLLLRVSPLSPYNVMNYVLGATGVKPRDYVLGSMLGALLPMAFYTSLGASVSDLAAVWSGEVEAPGWTKVVGLVVTVVATGLVTWRVHHQLKAVSRELDAA